MKARTGAMRRSSSRAPSAHGNQEVRRQAGDGLGNGQGGTDARARSCRPAAHGRASSWRRLATIRSERARAQLPPARQRVQTAPRSAVSCAGPFAPVGSAWTPTRACGLRGRTPPPSAPVLGTADGRQGSAATRTLTAHEPVVSRAMHLLLLAGAPEAPLAWRLSPCPCARALPSERGDAGSGPRARLAC